MQAENSVKFRRVAGGGYSQAFQEHAYPVEAFRIDVV
jgi:hypothetical protein